MWTIIIGLFTEKYFPLSKTHIMLSFYFSALICSYCHFRQPLSLSIFIEFAQLLFEGYIAQCPIANQIFRNDFPKNSAHYLPSLEFIRSITKFKEFAALFAVGGGWLLAVGFLADFQLRNYNLCGP